MSIEPRDVVARYQVRLAARVPEGLAAYEDTFEKLTRFYPEWTLKSVLRYVANPLSRDASIDLYDAVQGLVMTAYKVQAILRGSGGGALQAVWPDAEQAVAGMIKLAIQVTDETDFLRGVAGYAPDLREKAPTRIRRIRALLQKFVKDASPLETIGVPMADLTGAVRIAAHPYDVEIDHGYDQPLSGGHDIMKRLQDQLLIEQGREPREKNPRLASGNIITSAKVTGRHKIIWVDTYHSISDATVDEVQKASRQMVDALTKLVWDSEPINQPLRTGRISMGRNDPGDPDKIEVEPVSSWIVLHALATYEVWTEGGREEVQAAFIETFRQAGIRLER